ncbi:SET domain-containing protein [Pyrenochaeta sp. DS3sAY3a]|nr:SET domain-containing protein [Pyrenochaeta sp. DS3sAY3a]
MGITTSTPMYTIEDVPGKGKGLVAAKDIPKGTRILTEEPIIRVEPPIGSMKHLEACISEQVISLSDQQSQDFISLANIYPYSTPSEQWRGIFRTNALPTGPLLDTGGVFLTASRINHGCDNNTAHFWNENLQKLTIHAVRDIPHGEELTIFYLSSRRNRDARREELQQNFKFTCTCTLCSLPPEQCKDSDAKLDRVHAIDLIIEQRGERGLVQKPRQMLHYVHEQVLLWSSPLPNNVGLTRAYPDAFQVAIANGDLARAKVFAERVVALYLISLGADSPDVLEYRRLALDPASHDYYGMSMKWKTGVGEVPRGMGTEEFEKWLWRK